MRRAAVLAIRTLACLALALAAFACFAGQAAAAPAPAAPAASHGHFIRSCGKAKAGFASCNAILNADAQPNAGGGTPSGYGPSDLQSAYNLAAAAAANGAGTTVAIVDAYNDPNLGYAGDNLDVYRSQYGLPAVSHPSNCPVPAGTAGPWFCKVSQSGTTSYPSNDAGWSQEISLDVDMVSAVCPKCNILLVEASSNGYADLGTAVNEAATLGASAISNSYGGSESSSETTYDQYYNHPGIAVTVSSGDSGYGVEYPAASPYVTAVGGTNLTRNSGTARGWSETVWGSTTSGSNGAGSGCSAYEPQQSWQAIGDITSVCAKRAVADVSAVADPATGVAVYDDYCPFWSQFFGGCGRGWMVFGGTSVASPIIASVYALAGNASSLTYGSYPYSHTANLNDVTSGANGSCGNRLCTGAVGWDGPTGLGTPNGTGGF